MDIFIIIYSYKELHYNLKMAIKYTTYLCVLFCCVLYTNASQYTIYFVYLINIIIIIININNINELLVL